MQLSIIIVSYNVKYFLEQCLYSVQRAIKDLDAECIVIDNNSSDGSRQWLEPKFSWVSFIWQKENDGFGKANNKAMQQARGKQILFLNPDTLIAEDSLSLCLQQMQADEKIGALGVHMIDGSGRFLKESKRGLPTASAAFYRLSGLAALFPKSKKLAAYYAGHLPANQSSEVDVLAGAFLMISKKAALDTGGFDEDFFMYGEDVDLCYRIKKAGHKVFYFAATGIIHFKGESTQRLSAAYNKHFYGAMLLFVQKHFSQQRSLIFFTRLANFFQKKIAIFKAAIIRGMQRPPKNFQTLIAGTQQEQDACIQILKHATKPIPIMGRLAVAPNESTAALESFFAVKRWVGLKNINQVVMCIGQLSVKQIMAAMQDAAGKKQFLFWHRQSQSIVGSSSKNRQGDVIASPQKQPANFLSQ